MEGAEWDRRTLQLLPKDEVEKGCVLETVPAPLGTDGVVDDGAGVIFELASAGHVRKGSVYLGFGGGEGEVDDNAIPTRLCVHNQDFAGC